MAAVGDCPVTVTPFKQGVAPFTATIKPQSVCGYNQNNQWYCPWQLGDAIPSTAVQALTPIFAYAAANCNPDEINIYDCGAVFGKFPKISTLWDQYKLIMDGTAGPFIANNADCVKQTITRSYWAFSSSIYGMIGAVMAVFAMMI